MPFDRSLDMLRRELGADDVQKARERLERAIKKAWLVPSPGIPQSTLDPNVPLRIQVTSLPGSGDTEQARYHLSISLSESSCRSKAGSAAGLSPLNSAPIRFQRSASVRPTG